MELVKLIGLLQGKTDVIAQYKYNYLNNVFDLFLFKLHGMIFCKHR